MPYFKVMLLGKGIDMPFESRPDSVVGFFTTRTVHADSHEAAVEAAKALVMSEWRAGGEYEPSNRGGPPVLEVEAVYGVGRLRGWWSGPGRGYTFFAHED